MLVNRNRRRGNKGIPDDIIEEAFGARRWLNCTFYGESQTTVSDKAKAYFKRYPPDGYSTFASPPVQLNKKTWFVKVRRFSTCD